MVIVGRSVWDGLSGRGCTDRCSSFEESFTLALPSWTVIQIDDVVDVYEGKRPVGNFSVAHIFEVPL